MENTRIADLVQNIAELDEPSQRAFVESLFGAFDEKTMVPEAELADSLLIYADG